MSEIPLNYRTTYEWTGLDMNGEVRIGDLPRLPTGTPLSLDRYCPEHILVVAAEACLANYVLLIASRSKLAVKSYKSSAEGELEKDGSGFRFKRITIRPTLVVEPGKEAAGERIITRAHELCMVARAMNIPVEIEPTITAA